MQIYSQPADIVSQVLNFGQSAPIDVQFAADDIHASYALARELKRSMETIPGAVDVRIPQVLDYPTLQVAVDRDKALELGITENDVALEYAVFARLQYRSLSPANGSTGVLA